MIVCADHGEEFGDHGLFEHGESLYRPEIRVPLLIVLPSRSHSGSVVRETVSLRELPATIVDLAGLAAGAPFPGRSLARFWGDPPPQGAQSSDVSEAVVAELPEPNPANPSFGRSPAIQGPLISLSQGDYVYIRNERNGQEELFQAHDDPGELFNLAKVKEMQPLLLGFRQRLDKIKIRP